MNLREASLRMTIFYSFGFTRRDRPYSARRYLLVDVARDCNLGNDGLEEAGELVFDAMAGLHDLRVVDGFVEDAGGHVGDERDAEDFEPHVAGDDDFVDGGHADEVGSEGAEGADLGGGLVAGAEDGEVDALAEWNILPAGFGVGERAELGRVCRGHVEEAWTELCFVGTEGGVGAGEVDVIGDSNEAALLVAGVDASGGVGDDEGFRAEQTEDAGGEGDFGERVAFVGVDAALHDGDGNSGDGAENELAGVAFDGGLREVWDVGVGNGGGIFDLRREVAEAGAEDDAEARRQRREGADVGYGGDGLGVLVGHCRM